MNKGLGPRSDLAYIINEGEDRWDCTLKEEDEKKLNKYYVKLVDITVKCDEVRGDNCKAVYKLDKKEGFGL